MNAFEILVSLVLFAPVLAWVALNLLLYAEARYTLQPPAPAASQAPLPSQPVEVAFEPEYRKAA